jgi:hypothetical protein
MEINVIGIAQHLILVTVTVPAAAMENASATTTTNYIPIVPDNYYLVKVWSERRRVCGCSAYYSLYRRHVQETSSTRASL